MPPERCWFCSSPGNHAAEPDGNPLCPRCRAQLEDFRAWLQRLAGPSLIPMLPRRQVLFPRTERAG